MKSASPVRIRNMTRDDIPEVQRLEATCFPTIPSDRYWKPEMLEAHVDIFAAGQFVAELDGRIVGSATDLRVPIEKALRPHTWREIAGNGYLTTHDPKGDVLYGTEVMVHPDARRRGIARSLYKHRKDLIRRENLRAFVTGGRIPGYGILSPTMSANDYVKSVVRGSLIDRTLTPQLRSGMTVAGIMPNYITDPSSNGFATLLVWWNLDYKATRSIQPSEQTPRGPQAGAARAPGERSRFSPED